MQIVNLTPTHLRTSQKSRDGFSHLFQAVSSVKQHIDTLLYIGYNVFIVFIVDRLT